MAAIKAAQQKMKVVCVEQRGTLGGTCLNVGCIPSKALLHASHLYYNSMHGLAKYGITVNGKVQLELGKMMGQKEKSVSQLTSGIEFLFKKYQVGYVKGKGRILGPHEVEASLPDGGRETLTRRTSSSPPDPPPPPFPASRWTRKGSCLLRGLCPSRRSPGGWWWWVQG